MRFLVVGPAPSCDVAGRFAIAAHQGLNKVAFRGRVRGRLLEAGTYTIVPQAAASRRRPKVVAVAIDERGIRPTAPVRWRNCDPVATTSGAITAGSGPSSGLRASGVAATRMIAPGKRDEAAGNGLFPTFGWLPSLPESSEFSVLLFVLLGLSIALLSIASVEPGHTLRFRTVRIVARHQGQIAWLGGALFVSAILLYFLV